MIAIARSAEARRTCLDRTAQFALHRGEILRGRFVSECPLAHHVGAQCRMPHVSGVVDPFWEPIDGIEILREGVPRPFDAGFHRLGRDIFSALEVADYALPVFLCTGGERET